MRQKVSLILTLSAWLFATGSQWDLVQTFAWGRMITGYAQEMSLPAAVKKTFSPETMCELCHAVADAKQSSESEAGVPGTKTLGKPVLVCAPDRSAFLAPSLIHLESLPALLSPASIDRATPPSPPPRRLA
jgi:hypothetical protein